MRIQVDGASLFVETLGSGTSMLCMHGGMGLDHSILRPRLDPLAERLQMVFYDHRGNGQSTDRGNGTDLTIEHWVADAEALRRQLGGGRVFVFGWSFGGCVALRYALEYRDRIAGLVLCSAAPAFDYLGSVMEDLASRQHPDRVQAVVEFSTRPCADDEACRRGWESIFPMYFRRWDLGYEALLDATHVRAAAFNRCWSGGLAAEFSVLDRLGEIDVPTLILAGKHDWIAPPAHTADRLHAAIPGSRLRVFEESGHFPFIEEPEALLAVVGDWITDVEGGRV